jgi:hypothetical protein
MTSNNSGPRDPSSGSHLVHCREGALNSFILWQNWTQLEGKEPITRLDMAQASSTSSSTCDQASILRAIATADISIRVIPARVEIMNTQPRIQGENESLTQTTPSVPLVSMTSLRDPQAQSNRAHAPYGDNNAPSVNVPTGIRYPHN